MKSIALFIFTASCFLQFTFTRAYFHQEAYYTDFLRKHDEISHNAGNLNLKITKESLNSLVDKLGDQITGLDTELFNFEDESSDWDEFEDIYLTRWDQDSGEDDEQKDENWSDFSDLVSESADITTKYEKFACSYSKIFSVTGNGTKRFSKVHESSKEGGNLDSEVQGSLDTQITSDSSGKIGALLNTTVYTEGKEYKTKVTIKSTITSKGTEKKSGKSNNKFVSVSSSNMTSTLQVGNKTFPLKISARSGAETFKAPFGIYLTLFESSIDVKLNGANDNGKLRGEITSRIIFSKKGKSLIKSIFKGYLMSEGENYEGVKMFKVHSHIWAKTVQNSSNVQISTYSKGKVYGKMKIEKKLKVFTGSGVVSYEKDIVTLPKGSDVKEHEHVVRWMIRDLLERKFIRSGGMREQILNI